MHDFNFIACLFCFKGFHYILLQGARGGDRESEGDIIGFQMYFLLTRAESYEMNRNFILASIFSFTNTSNRNY